MNELEFWDTYRTSQNELHLSENKKTALMHDAQKATEAKTASQASSPQPIFAHEKTERSSSKPRKSTWSPTDNKGSQKLHPRKRLPRFAAPVAACLIILCLAVGIIAVSANLGNSRKGSGAASVTPDFSLQAYASGTDTILEMGNDNQIIFSREPTASSRVASKQDYLSNGYYTGCLFQVEGEGITRIQASLSSGMLYRHTYEHFKAGDEPERLRELAGWKPHARGIGEYYGNYDNVAMVPKNDDGLPEDASDRQFVIALTKRLGSVIDVPIDTTSGGAYSGTYFGFWTNGDYGDVPEDSEADAVINLFEGTTLTVTATFEDGHTTTQIIELHAADVRASQEQDSQGTWFTVLHPEIIDTSNTDLQRGVDYERTLYGKIVETNSGSFPGSLENANEYENIVDAPMTFEKLPLSREAGVTIDQVNMQSSGEVGSVRLTDDSFFNISNLKVIHKGKHLPDGITLDSLESGFGSWEYFRRVVSQIDGYTLDENGSPSDGFTWVMLEADITSLQEGDSYAFANHFGAALNFAIVEEDKVFNPLSRSFALKTNDSWWNELDSDGSLNLERGHIPFAPYETKTIQWFEIVPNFFLDDPSLFFSVYTESQTTVGLEITLP